MSKLVDVLYIGEVQCCYGEGRESFKEKRSHVSDLGDHMLERKQGFEKPRTLKASFERSINLRGYAPIALYLVVVKKETKEERGRNGQS